MYLTFYNKTKYIYTVCGSHRNLLSNPQIHSSAFTVVDVVQASIKPVRYP